MELFSEIYSAYYNAVSKILSKKDLSEKDMQKIINDNAFSESSIYLIPKLKKEWALLSEENGIYNSRLKNIPKMPLTTLEKRWLKAILSDSKINLFLDNKAIKQISEYLSDIKPLFNYSHFLFFDRFTDGDDYQNPDYIYFFREICNAIINKTILKITFVSSKNKKITGKFVPLKFEYSPKNDKFRVYAADISGNNMLINISRIESIENLNKTYEKPVDFEEVFKQKRCLEPVCIEVSSKRNGVERFMMEFASYEKRAELSDDGKKCKVYIWYNLQDETELLIRLLSFGPVLEIKSPVRFRKLAEERIKKQYELIYKSI